MRCGTWEVPGSHISLACGSSEQAERCEILYRVYPTLLHSLPYPPQTHPHTATLLIDLEDIWQRRQCNAPFHGTLTCLLRLSEGVARL